MLLGVLHQKPGSDFLFNALYSSPFDTCVGMI